MKTREEKKKIIEYLEWLRDELQDHYENYISTSVSYAQIDLNIKNEDFDDWVEKAFEIL